MIWTRSLVALALGTATLASAALGQLPTPQLHAVFPPGGKAGSTVDASTTGADLDEAHRLLFTHPGISADPVTAAPSEFQSPRPISGKFQIKIAPDVPPGLYEVRAVGESGVSNPRRFVVGAASEVVETEPNNEPAQANALPLGGVANGAADGDGFDYYKIKLPKDQRVLIVCQARTIDSRLEPTVVLLNPDGAEIARARTDARGDAIVDVQVPAEGEYFVQVHDVVYRGGPGFFYRLAATTGPRVDFVFPPSAVPGTKSQFTFYGRNLPGGAKTDLVLDGRPLDAVTIEIDVPGDAAARANLPVGSCVEPEESGQDAFEFRLPTPTGPANPLPIFFATAPILREQEPNNDPAKPQIVSLPCEIVGQFNPRGDVDVFQFPAKKGEVYWIEMLSQRLGANTDPYVLMQRVTQDGQGKEQVSIFQELDDDQTNLGGQNDRTFRTRSSDATYRWQVPDDGTYRLVVRDLYYRSRGNPQFVYRLAIRPPQPDFRLVAVPLGDGPPQDNGQVRLTGPLLRGGGVSAIQVLAFRRDGFDGEIELAVEGLPKGVTAPPAVIGPNSTSALVALVADPNAPDATANIKITGQSTIGGATVSRDARFGAVVWGAQNQQEAPRARLACTLPLTVAASSPAPARIQPAELKPYETYRGGKLEIPMQIARHADFKGPLQLQTRNVPPNINVGNVNVDANASAAKVTVNVNNNAAPGAYTFYLHAQTQWNNYRRGVKAADEAEKERQAVDQRVAEVVQASQVAQKAKLAAEQAANNMAAAVKQATEALAAAERELAPLPAQVKTAEMKLATAKAAWEKKQDDAALQQSVAAAQQELDAANARLKMATDKKTATLAAMQQAQANAKTAADAKAAADKAAAEAQARQQRAEQVKKQIEQRARELRNQANPRQVQNVIVVSTPIVVRVAASPVTVNVAPSPLAVKQGEKAELTVTITRMAGYNEPVEIALVAQGVKDVQAANVQIPAGQSQAKLIVHANAQAPVGEHKLIVEARTRVGGQNAAQRQEFALRIEPAPNKG